MSKTVEITHTRYRVKVIMGQRSTEEQQKAISNIAAKYYLAISMQCTSSGNTKLESSKNSK